MAIGNTQYDALMREYDDLRAENRHLLDRRHDEIKSVIPEYGVLEDKIADLGREAVMLALGGNKSAAKELSSNISELSKRKAELLKAAGYSEDYLDPIYTCKECQDTGYVGNEKCQCLKRKMTRIMYHQSNIEEILKVENFDNLSFDYYSDSEVEQMKGIVNTCKKYVSDFDRAHDNILFMGDCGVGKTYLTNCIAKALLDSGHSVIYFTSFDLFDTLARYTFRRGEEDAEIENINRDIFDCDLLIIDDLGTESVNSFVNTQLFRILNERIMRGKATVISTNLTLEGLNDTYSERSFSRIFGNYRIIKPEIADIRIKKRRLSQY